MKHLTSLIILLIASFSLKAQEGTSLEEYRYMSKGYLYQKELGLDIHKSGYQIKNLFTTTKGAQLIGLYKEGLSEIKALLIVIEDPTQAPIYICVPRSNSEDRVMSLYNLDVQRLVNVESRKLYDNAMQEFLFSSLSSSFGVNKSTVESRPKDAEITKPTDDSETPSSQVAYNDEHHEDELVSKGGTEPEEMENDEPLDATSHETDNTPAENAGESVFKKAVTSIGGDLRSRNIMIAPNVEVDAEKEGTIVVKVCVDMDGYVMSSRLNQRGTTTTDKDLKEVAIDAALRYRFNKSERKEECGNITFEF